MTSVLKKEYDARASLKRCSSLHVCSRWYRAPEIILVEDIYDQASDMWGLGCIIYSILHVAFESKEQLKKRQNKDNYRHILFKGMYQFPLTPNPKPRGAIFDKHDQLYQTMQQLDELTIFLPTPIYQAIEIEQKNLREQAGRDYLKQVQTES